MNGLVYLQLFALIIYIIVIVIGLISSLRNRSIRRIISNGVLLFLFVFFLGYTLYLRFSLPEINLRGNEIEVIKLHEDYKDAGFELVHLNKKLKDEVVTNNYVDSDKIGVYDVTYTINYYGHIISTKRKVKVIDDELPIIELKGKDEINISFEADYIEPGYTATDNYDGDITEKVKVINDVKASPGKYEITNFIFS